MSFTGTRTQEQTATRTFQEQVRRITRNVQTDLLEIAATYGHLTREEALDYISDFRAFMGELFLEHIEIRWTSPGTIDLYDGYKYIIVNKEAVRTIDRPGGILYDPRVARCDFSIVVRHTDKWLEWDTASKEQFQKDKLTSGWVPATKVSYSKGRYVAEDRSYGDSSVVASRMRFERW